MRIFSFLFSLLLGQLFFSAHAQDVDALAETFGRLPDIHDIQVSPNGKKVLFLQNIEGNRIIVTRSFDNPGAANGIPFDGGEFRWARWTSNDNILAGLSMPYTRVSSTTVETTETRLLYVDWDGKNASNPVRRSDRGSVNNTQYMPQIQDSVLDFLDDEPEHIIMEIDANTPLYRSVYKVNLRTRGRDRIIRSRSPIQTWEVDHNGVVRYGEGIDRKSFLKENMAEAIYRKSEDADWMTLYKYDAITENSPFNFIGFTDNPEHIYVTMSNENGYDALYKYNVDTQAIFEEVLNLGNNRIYNIKINDKGELAEYSYFDYRENIVRTDEEGKVYQSLLDNAFPNEYAEIVSKTKDNKILIVRVSSPTNPGDYYLIDLEKNAKGKIVSNYQNIDRASLSEMKPIKYSARDGLEINGYLSLPAGSDGKNLPMIIMPHGGPMARDTWGFDYWVQFLTAQGYAVLQPNFRGSVGYGSDFESAGHQEWGRKMLEDINDGTKWMIEQGYANPDKICILGGSYGGYAALQAVVKDGALYKCSAALAGVFDLESFMNYRVNYFGYKVYENYVESDEWTLEEASPINNIDKYDIPVLLLHGEQDKVVREGQSKSFYRKMRRAKKDIKYVKLKDGDHFLSKQENRVRFLKEVGEFLKKHLH